MLDNPIEPVVYNTGLVRARDRPRGKRLPMVIERPQDMSDINEMVELGAMMAEEGAYHALQYSRDKTRLLGARILNDVKEEEFFAHVARIDGLIRAMMIAQLMPFYFSDQLIAQDLLLYVHPDFRGGTSAPRLLKNYIRWAKARGAAELCLGVTAGIANETAGRLYRANGFEHVGHIYKMRNV